MLHPSCASSPRPRQRQHVHYFPGRFRRLIFPENWDDAKLLLFLNQAAEVMAKELAENFVPHGNVRFAPDRIPELPLDRREGRFDIATLVVVGQELVTV